MISYATRVGRILNILKKTYPDAKIVLNYKTNWELLVAVILSAQCTDRMVNKVTAKLFKKYPTLDTYMNANPKEFEQDIRSTGFYKNKAKNILKTAKIIYEKYQGELPRTLAELITLPGVARKTANVILGNAYKVVEGIAVDTHVARISQRLRLVDLKKIGGGRNKVKVPGKNTIDFIKDANAEKIEKYLMRIIPKKDWFRFTYLIIDHGRAICKAQNPKCSNCPLKSLCPVIRN